MTTFPEQAVSPWPHRVAVLTACATVVLLLIGAKVTTLGVGMADTEWPTHPLHLFFASRSDAGYVIEHSHRLAGWFVGLCSIVLAVVVWCCERRRWVRWLGVAVLAGVSIQGLLGGYRVRLHAMLGTDLATVHGVFAQVVFALLVSLVLVTSAWWRAGPAELGPNRLRLEALSRSMSCLVLLQIVFGAVVRHTHLRLAQRLHILLAFGVVVLAVWLIRHLHETRDHRLRRMSWVLGGLLALQLVLGVEAWMMRFGSGVLPELQRVTIGSGMVRTLHFVTGSLVFAGTVVVVLLVHLRAPAEVLVTAGRPRQLEGAV